MLHQSERMLVVVLLSSCSTSQLDSSPISVGLHTSLLAPEEIVIDLL